jgi:hypothetical protein
MEEAKEAKAGGQAEWWKVGCPNNQRASEICVRSRRYILNSRKTSMKSNRAFCTLRGSEEVEWRKGKPSDGRQDVRYSKIPSGNENKLFLFSYVGLYGSRIARAAPQLQIDQRAWFHFTIMTGNGGSGFVSTTIWVSGLTGSIFLHRRAKETCFGLSPSFEAVYRRQGLSPKVSARTRFKLVASAVIVAGSILHAKSFQIQAAFLTMPRTTAQRLCICTSTGMRRKDPCYKLSVGPCARIRRFVFMHSLRMR